MTGTISQINIKIYHVYGHTKSREFINLNLNCIRTTKLKCKVFDIIICLNYFSINLNFKLKRKTRHDYQIKYALWPCHVKYPSQKVLHL